MDDKITIRDLKEKVAKFRDDRDWRRFHTPKNLSIAIAVEAAELMDLFKWSDDGDLEEVMMELADVVIYCLNLADALEIDLSSVVLEKLEQNGTKYPADEYKGKWKIG